MDQAEISSLENYLRKLLGSPALTVRAQGKNAEMVVGPEKVADITKDEDEGEMSYFVNMGVARESGARKDAPIDPAERARLEGLLKKRLDSGGLSVRPRPRKTDSAEIYVGEEFIGTLSRDEESREYAYFLTMSILDIDLED